MTDCFAGDVKQLYLGADRKSNPPHVYALVTEAYKQLFEATTESPVPKDQAIIITGESGAGKTFTTGKVLDFVDAVNASVPGGVTLTNLAMDYLSRFQVHLKVVHLSLSGLWIPCPLWMHLGMHACLG